MAQATKVISGLTILQKYGPVTVDAEHDVIYAGPDSAVEVSEVDRLALDEFGWRFDKSVDSWAKFT